MGSDRYRVIFVKTGILEKLGLNPPLGAIGIDELGRKLNDADADTYIVVLDIFSPYVNYIKRIISRIKHRDLVVLTAKPSSPLNLLLQRLIYNPLSNIIGSKFSLAIAISGELVRRIGYVDDIGRIVENARSIITIVMHEPLHEYFYMVYGRLPKPILLSLLETTRLVKFALVGLSGVLVNLAAVYTALSLLPSTLTYMLRIMIAAIIGFETSLTWNFTLHEIWTFRDLKLRRGFINRLIRWFKYHLASLGGLFSQTITITVLTGLFGVHIAASLITGVIIGFIVNYLVGRFYTWKE